MAMNDRPKGAPTMSDRTWHPGYPNPSETYEPRDEGTAYPEDRFTAMVNGAHVDGLATPARHSYDADGNMEAFDAQPPYALQGEGETNPARYTGAVGPVEGRS